MEQIIPEADEDRELTDIEIALKKERWKTLQAMRKELQDQLGDKSLRQMNAREKQYVMQRSDIWRELMGIKVVLMDHGELDHEMSELEEADP
jgi:hypothetical protein